MDRHNTNPYQTIAIRSANLKATLQTCYLCKCSMKDKSSFKPKPTRSSLQWQTLHMFFPKVVMKKNSSNQNTKFCRKKAYYEDYI